MIRALTSPVVLQVDGVAEEKAWDDEADMVVGIL
jgi:hypothetical protein